MIDIMVIRVSETAKILPKTGENLPFEPCDKMTHLNLSVDCKKTSIFLASDSLITLENLAKSTQANLKDFGLSSPQEPK